VRATINNINAAIAAKGGTEILVKGKGYFYFADGNAHEWESSSVYVFHLTDYTVEQWVDMWEFMRAQYLKKLADRED